MTTKTTKIKAVPVPEIVTVTDAEIHAEMLALGRERDALEVPRAQPRAFVDDGHRLVDASVAAARRVVDAALLDALQRPFMEAVIPAGLADAYVLAHEPSIAARWHELLDAGMPANRADPYRRDLSREQYTAERKRIAGEIAQRQGELDRRARAAKRAALDAEDEAAQAALPGEAS